MTLMAFAVAACNEKKPTTDIIAPKPVKKKPSAPVKMQASDHQETVAWVGSEYTVSIKRRVDTSLPMIEDESGNKYYDNTIEVKVVRPDGSEFFCKTFKKEDFASQTTEDYLKKSAMLGIVFEKAEGDNLIFAASVGSPDVLSDEYIPLVITLSRMGNVNIQKDTRLDSSDENTESEDEGV